MRPTKYVGNQDAPTPGVSVSPPLADMAAAAAKVMQLMQRLGMNRNQLAQQLGITIGPLYEWFNCSNTHEESVLAAGDAATRWHETNTDTPTPDPSPVHAAAVVARVRQLMERLKTNRYQLAQKLGITRASLYQWFDGSNTQQKSVMAAGDEAMRWYEANKDTLTPCASAGTASSALARRAVLDASPAYDAAAAMTAATMDAAGRVRQLMERLRMTGKRLAQQLGIDKRCLSDWFSGRNKQQRVITAGDKAWRWYEANKDAATPDAPSVYSAAAVARVRQLMERLGMNRNQLAQKLGITEGGLNEWLNCSNDQQVVADAGEEAMRWYEANNDAPTPDALPPPPEMNQKGVIRRGHHTPLQVHLLIFNGTRCLLVSPVLITEYKMRIENDFPLEF